MIDNIGTEWVDYEQDTHEVFFNGDISNETRRKIIALIQKMREYQGAIK